MGTVVVAALTATAGLFALVGVAPSRSAPPAAVVLPAAPVEESTVPSTAAIATTTTTTSTAITTSTTTSTSTTTPPTSTTTVSTTTEPAGPPPIVPTSVAASNEVVGVGGTVRFSGTCAARDGRVGGPLVVWVIGDTTEQVVTRTSGAAWTYDWVAPTDPARIRSYAFQFWCGVPASQPIGYPLDLQPTVDMVASLPPTPPTPGGGSGGKPGGPAPTIPTTD